MKAVQRWSQYTYIAPWWSLATPSQEPGSKFSHGVAFQAPKKSPCSGRKYFLLDLGLSGQELLDCIAEGFSLGKYQEPSVCMSFCEMRRKCPTCRRVTWSTWKQSHLDELFWCTVENMTVEVGPALPLDSKKDHWLDQRHRRAGRDPEAKCFMMDHRGAARVRRIKTVRTSWRSKWKKNQSSGVRLRPGLHSGSWCPFLISCLYPSPYIDRYLHLHLLERCLQI